MNRTSAAAGPRRRVARAAWCALACALTLGAVAWSDPGFDAGVARREVAAQRAQPAGPIEPLPLLDLGETVPLQMARDPFLAPSSAP
jgi:hypothetical protein